MTTTTIEQRIAQKEAELARLRQQSRALETGQKIILGGLLLSAARADPEMRAWLLGKAATLVTREVDRKRLAPLLAELAALPATGNGPG
ncbi:hypothetical protein D9M71_656520 [compost metagenome]